MVRAVASHEEGHGFGPSLGPFSVDFTCSPCACVGFLRVLPESKNMRVRQIGNTKLSTGTVCVHFNGCMFVCLSLWPCDGDLSRVLPSLRPMTAEWKRRFMDDWMDAFPNLVHFQYRLNRQAFGNSPEMLVGEASVKHFIPDG